MKEKLRNVCLFYAGTGFPTKYQGNTSGDFPFYKVSDIANNERSGNMYLEECNNFISSDVAKTIKGKIVPKGTVVFAKIGEALKLNRRAITSVNCLIDNNAIGIAPQEDKLDLSYFYFYMKKLRMELLSESTTVPSVRKSRLENHFITVPTMFEQKKIARTLENLFQQVDRKKKQVLEYDDLIKSRFVEKFGDPILNDKGLNLVILKDLTTKISSGTTPKGGRQVYVDEGVMFFRSQNVWKNRIEMKGISYIDEQTHKKMPKSSLKYGDILMTKTGRINTENSSLGRAAMYVGEDYRSNVNGHVYLIRMNDIAVREFVLFIITTLEYRDYIRSVCVGGIDKRQLNKNHIENFPIILPSRKRQEDFVTLLKQVDKLKFGVQKSLDETQTLFDSLIQEYFV